MNACAKTIGLFGGTFDPVHIGHIQMALEAKKLLGLDEIRLVPCHLPPHRDQPQLSSSQRLELLQLAIANLEGVTVDDREMFREGPSYTVDTLKALRSEYGDTVSLVLIVGADAYNQLSSWERWPELPVLANIVVLQRPGYELPKTGILADWLQAAPLAQIHQQPAGLVLALDQIQVDVSATEIREQLAAGKLPDELVPAVSDYIVEHQLYGFKMVN